MLLATDGQLATPEIDADIFRFCALVTDTRHGRRPDGWQLAWRARELATIILVIYITEARATERSLHCVPGRAIIAKPFVHAQFYSALNSVFKHALGEPWQASTVPVGYTGSLSLLGKPPF